MDVVFIGTGGGRINLLKQVRGTGGFRINSRSANVHVDPGPGALVHSVRLKQSPLQLDAVIVTHNHIDHMGDAMVMIEGMSNYGLKKKGIFIGSREMVEKGISEWHRSKPALIHSAAYGEKKRFETEKGSFELEVIEVKHDEDSAFGFKLYMDQKVLGHITDTEYTENLGKSFTGCDCLIVNCIKPEADKYKGHLKSNDVIEILKKAKPKLCIITHMGMKMLRMGPSTEAERIGKESGVETVAARDGMRFEI